MPIFLVLLVFQFFFPLFHSTTYYVDCQGPSGDGTSPSTPFLDLASMKTVPANPGDTFLLKRGCIWFESISFGSISGTSGNLITFSSYGSESDPKPTISGYTSLSSLTWEHHDGEIYSATIDATIPQVMMNRNSPIILNISHYPHNAPFEGGYFHFSQDVSSGDPTIRLIASESTNFFALDDSFIGPGTYLLSKVRNWSVRAMSILSVDRIGETLGVSSVDGWGLLENYGFFLMNNVAFMQEGSWVYDDVAKKLYVWCVGGGSPASVDLFYTGFESDWGLFECWNCEFVVIENIQVEFSGTDSIVAGAANVVTIQDCDVEWGSGGGIVLHESVDSIVQRNRISHMLHTAVISGGGGVPPFRDGSGTLFTENSIDGVGEWGGLIRSLLPLDTIQNSLFAGMTIQGTGHTVTRNEIAQTGRDGIALNGIGHRVVENYIHDIGEVFNDVAMIYIFGPEHYVEKNIGHHCYRESSWGTPDGYEYVPCNGLYIDGAGVESYDVTFIGNVMSDVNWGFQLYNARTVTARNNLMFNTWAEALEVSESSASPNPQGWACCHTIENNIFVSAGTLPPQEKPVAGLYGYSGSSDTFITSMTNNRYYGYNHVLVRRLNGGVRSWDHTSLEAWKRLSGFDSGSSMIGGGIYERESPATDYVITSKNLIQNGGFSWENTSLWSCWDGNFLSMEYDTTWNGGNLKTTYTGAKNPSYWYAISQCPFDVNQGDSFLFKYTIGASSDDYLDFTLRRNEPPYDDIILSLPYSVLGDEKIADEVIWTYEESDPLSPGRIDFGCGDLADSFYLDDVEGFRVTVTPREEDMDRALKDFTLFTNPSSESIEVSGKRYCDLDGNEIDSDITVAPYAGVLVMNCFCNTDGTCNNHESKRSCSVDCGFDYVTWVIVGVFSAVGAILALATS